MREVRLRLVAEGPEASSQHMRQSVLSKPVLGTETEVWREVEGHAEYEVSNFGRVRRITYIKPYIDGNGYPALKLYRRQRGYACRVHRLVAKAGFIGLPPVEATEVNHIDGDKLNPCANNLEWATRLHNQQHAERLGLVVHRRGERHGMAKLTAPQVQCMRHLRGLWRQRSMARHFGISQHTIMAVLTRKVWRHV